MGRNDVVEIALVRIASGAAANVAVLLSIKRYYSFFIEVIKGGRCVFVSPLHRNAQVLCQKKTHVLVIAVTYESTSAVDKFFEDFRLK